MNSHLKTENLRISSLNPVYNQSEDVVVRRAQAHKRDFYVVARKMIKSHLLQQRHDNDISFNLQDGRKKYYHR